MTSFAVLSAGSIAQRFVSGVGHMSPAVVRLSRGDSLSISIDELEKLCGTDPELTLRIMALANSAFYSRHYEVTSLRSAIIVLGVKIIQNLAASILAKSVLSCSDAATMKLWQHSQAVGVAAHCLADVHEAIDPRMAFVAGLLHDVGILAVLKYEPDLYDRTTLTDTACLSRTNVQERAWFANDHGNIGAEIAELLGLAPELCSAIRYHGGQESSTRNIPTLEAAILVADRLANECGYALPVDCKTSDDQYRSAVASLRLVESDLDVLANCLEHRIKQTAGLLAASGDFE